MVTVAFEWSNISKSLLPVRDPRAGSLDAVNLRSNPDERHAARAPAGRPVLPCGQPEAIPQYDKRAGPDPFHGRFLLLNPAWQAP